MTDTAAPAAITTVYVIPCGGEKTTEPATARDLYTGSLFRHQLAAAEAAASFDDGAAMILVLSAKYGLVNLSRVLEPYDQRMTDAGSVSAVALAEQVRQLGDVTLYTFLPRAYRLRLQHAVDLANELGGEEDPWLTVQDVYEAAPGIGYQRGVASSVRRSV